MLNLVIDIGNSYTKIAFFNQQKLTELYVKEGFDVHFLSTLIKENKKANVLVSSVHPTNGLTMHLNNKQQIIILNTQTPVPVINKYKTPKTLGTDRLAAVAGAAALHPETPVLVIDAGTCITYDFIDGQKQYFGGSIAPGLNMRYQAMHTFTQKLPLLQADKNFDMPYGDDTTSAINSGAINGMYYEICGFINRYQQQNKNLKIILCGGDASFFDTRLKNSIFADHITVEPNLVLIGLNAIVNYQNDQNL